MAISSFGITLKWGEDAESVAKKVDIKDFGDLIGDPEMLDTTTLSDAQTTNIPGIRSSNVIPFTCNYTSADYAACKADEGKKLYYELELNDKSKFTWQGQHTLGMPGKGVNEVIDFTINVVASTTVEFVPATA